MTTGTHAYDGYTSLSFERPEPGIVLVTILAGERMGVLEQSELGRAWLEIAADADCRAVILAGTPNCFGRGGQVQKVQADFATTGLIMDGAYDLVYNMLRVPQPIVSAVMGEAHGVGLAVALLADMSIVDNDAELTDGHVLIGIPPGDHAVMIWPLLCSMAKAKYYLLTGRSLDGREAERIGLVTKCVPKDEVMGEALALASSLAAGPPWTLRWAKRALNNWVRSAGPAYDASLGWEMLGLLGPERIEATNAILEGRPPDFSACTAVPTMRSGEGTSAA